MIMAPDLLHKTLSDDTLAMSCSYDGKVATVQVEQGPGQSVSQAIEDVLYEKAIILEGAFLSLTDFGPELLSPRHSWQHDQTYGGKACWTIVSQLPGSLRIHHLIDPETGFERALKAGAVGYLMKDTPTERLIEAIYEVSYGRLALSPAISNQLLSNFSRWCIETPGELGCLSYRELMVMT